MEPIVDLPDNCDAGADEPLRLARVEYAKGGEDIDSVEVFDRQSWLEAGHDDETWRTLAQQQFEGNNVGGLDGRRIVRVELPGWWVDSEAEDADPYDTTWKGAYGAVYGEAATLAVVDHNWSADRAAWSFPHIRDTNGNWKQPGKYGPGGPKSLLPVTFPVGEVRPVDTQKVSRQEARDAAPKADNAPEYDWAAAIEKAEQRAEAHAQSADREVDLSAVKTLEDQGKAAHVAANRAVVKFNDEYQDTHDVSPDPATLTAAAEAIGEAVRRSKGLDDPREDDEEVAAQ